MTEVTEKSDGSTAPRLPFAAHVQVLPERVQLKVSEIGDPDTPGTRASMAARPNPTAMALMV
jgi:hypothetical protein